MSIFTYFFNFNYFFAEREIHQVVGHVAQLIAYWPEHVPEQFSGIITRSTPGSQGHCWPSYQHHFLQDEGKNCLFNHSISSNFLFTTKFNCINDWNINARRFTFVQMLNCLSNHYTKILLSLQACLKTLKGANDRLSLKLCNWAEHRMLM